MCRLGTDDSSRIVWLKPHAAAYCRLRLFRRYVSGAFPGRDRHSKALQEPAWNVFYVFECACVLPDVYMRQLVNQDTREGISRLSQLFDKYTSSVVELPNVTAGALLKLV